ncbi:hypothetical protein BKA65DRAFT_472979 [Rhexocercosporidium sp. MPI-PUGE-AT-0058]|nr:hypothetical protein BKA65DRAFT_472979 [Rhexocercosporidium sp. MPI-PUGE-AT-0058]
MQPTDLIIEKRLIQLRELDTSIGSSTIQIRPMPALACDRLEITSAFNLTRPQQQKIPSPIENRVPPLPGIMVIEGPLPYPTTISAGSVNLERSENMQTTGIDARPLANDVKFAKALTSLGKEDKYDISLTLAQCGQQDATRIPRKNGFGDFCFGRLIDRGDMWNKAPATKFRDYWMKFSHGVPVQEIGGYRRHGQFPFFKLPIELRHKILRFILAPFYQYDADTKMSYIEFCISQNDVARYKTEEGYRFSKNLEHYLKTTTGSGAMDETFVREGIASRNMSRYEYVQAQARFLYKKEALQHKHKACPNRGGDYNLYARAARIISSADYPNHDFVYLDYFLADRPATRTGISKIHFTLDLEDPWINYDFGGEECFAVCKAIADIVPAGIFSSFSIHYNEHDWLDLLRSRGREEKKRIIQNLGSLLTNETFELYVGVSVVDDDHPDEYVEDVAERLSDEFEPLVQAIILQNGPKKTPEPPQTEIGGYLNNRLS